MSKENQPRLLRAVVVDYDCYALSPETLNAALDDISGDVAPAFISRSHSGGVHAIWLLEEPVWVMSPDLRKRLLNWFKKHLKLGQLLPNMDDKVFHDAMIYHHAGRDWQACDGKLITTNTVSRAMLECGESANFKGSGVAVPLEIVAAEVDARFPGRWVGAFEENARGVRFWEEGADAMSALVKPEGMLCYTGDKSFMDWATLFGRSFVEKFLDDKIGGASDCAWFDGREFWVYSDATAAWRTAKSDEMARKLKVQFGLSSKDKGENATEVERALHQICTVNHVASAGPFVQRPAGILLFEGKRHLNIASVKPCMPADGECGPDDFPWIENFLEHSFLDTKDGNDQLLLGDWAGQPQEQLMRFLAWLKRAYLAGLNYAPAQGQVLVLAGESGCGKTLLADVLIGGALGGKKDASRYLLGESHFSKKLFEMPCWVVNDAVAASDPARKARYNSLVKRVAANREFESEAKFVDAVDVAWQGRLVITCNVDPESIGVMPQLDASIADKVLALRCWGDSDDSAAEELAARKWFGIWKGRTPDQNVQHELPAFLRWLTTWEIPSWIPTDARFGYKAYAHPELKAVADSASYFASFEEVLKTYLAAYFLANPELKEWCGTATQLAEVMQADDSPVKSSTKNYSGRGISRDLSNMVARQKCWKRLKDGYAKYHFDKEKWCEQAGN